jgi:PKD repeat protein
MSLRTTVFCSILLAGGIKAVTAQEVTSNRVVGVTFNTSFPTQLSIDRGRLIWRDTDLNSGKYLLKYYSGAEIFTLDSGLVGVAAGIGGDVVVWNTPGELVNAFDMRSWQTAPIGSSYNPDFSQPVSVSNGFAAYAQRKAGTGTRIVLHRFASGTDTVFSAGTWNTWPSVHQGQLAWVASDSESVIASSNIFFYDGMTTRNLSGTTGWGNRNPILKDAQIAWLQSNGSASRVKLFTGDSVTTLAQPSNSTTIITGYDLSGGIAVAALKDTSTGKGSVRIFDSETGLATAVSDSNGPSSPRIDNGMVVWQSGTGVGRRVEIYIVNLGFRGEYSGGEKPVVSADQAAWTNGDAVEMYGAVTLLKLTNDGMNGWQQTKFKTIDSTHVVWGNFANSTNMRLFYGDGATTTELTDSNTTVDLVMANDGIVIWRRNFDSLYFYDGTHPPVKFLDTVQSENAYVAGGSVGFFGARTGGGDLFKHPWLYQIGPAKLTKLANDSSNAWNVLCDGNTACWLNTKTRRLLFYDGSGTSVLSDSTTDYDYSYRNGAIVWTEQRGGYSQVFLYDVAGKTKTQLTNGASMKAYPITEGVHVVWYEAAPASLAGTVMMYYDIASRRLTHVVNGSYNPLFWNWMSNGKIAWAQSDGTVVSFDGNVISVLQPNDGFRTFSGIYLDREMAVWKAASGTAADNNGDVYRQKLHPHAAFDASNIAGKSPLAVSFVNRSWEGARSSSWDFGDGTSSTEVSPTHTYGTPGRYTVTLTVNGPTGPVTAKKVRLVRALSSTSVANGEQEMPERFELSQNYPNPFNPLTVISYQVPAASLVSIRVYDILGREVATLVNEVNQPGAHSVTWNASNMASGVYFYTVKAGIAFRTRKMVLLR